MAESSTEPLAAWRDSIAWDCCIATSSQTTSWPGIKKEGYKRALTKGTAEESRGGKGIGDGTPEYAAPETTTRSWSLTAEIYSVIVCFAKVVLGRCPFGR